MYYVSYYSFKSILVNAKMMYYLKKVKQNIFNLNVSYFAKLLNTLLKMSFEQICVVNTVALISDEMNVSYTELLEKVGVGEDVLVAVVENLLRILVQELRVSKSSENLKTVWRLLWIPYFCEPDENPITGNSRYYNLCINNFVLKGIRDKANELYNIRMSEVKDNTAIATEVKEEKKKRAPAKKKTEPVVSEVTVNEVTVSDTAEPSTEVKEKKKRAPPKKKEPVSDEATVSEATTTETVTAVVEEAVPTAEVKEKKKRAPPKKKEPVSEATVSEATASEVVTETVVPTAEVKEKKKRAPPKKKEPVSEATTTETVGAVVEAVPTAEVKEKKKRAPSKKKELVSEATTSEATTSEATTSEATTSEVTVTEEPVVVEKKKRAPAKKKGTDQVVA